MYAITVRMNAKVRNEQTKTWHKLAAATVANATRPDGCLFYFLIGGVKFSAGWGEGDVTVDAR